MEHFSHKIAFHELIKGFLSLAYVESFAKNALGMVRLAVLSGYGDATDLHRWDFIQGRGG